MSNYNFVKNQNRVVKSARNGSKLVAFIIIVIVSFSAVLSAVFSGLLLYKDSRKTAYADEVVTSESFIGSMLYVPATNVFKSTVVDDSIINALNYKSNFRWYSNYRTTFFNFFLKFNYISGNFDSFGIFLLDNYNTNACRIYDSSHNLLPLSNFDNPYIEDLDNLTMLPYSPGNSNIYFISGSEADNFYLGSFEYYFSSSSFGVPLCCEIRTDNGLEVATNLYFYQIVVNYYDGLDFNTANLFSIRFTYVTGSFKYFYNLNDRIYYYNDIQDDPSIQYVNGYNYGYNEGYDTGYTEGSDRGYGVGYNTGFYNGKNEGIAQSNDYSFLGLMGAIVDAPIKAFTSLLNFNLLGFNMLNFFTGLLTLALILWIVSKILGGK